LNAKDIGKYTKVMSYEIIDGVDYYPNKINRKPFAIRGEYK